MHSLSLSMVTEEVKELLVLLINGQHRNFYLTCGTPTKVVSWPGIHTQSVRWQHGSIIISIKLRGAKCDGNGNVMEMLQKNVFGYKVNKNFRVCPLLLGRVGLPETHFFRPNCAKSLQSVIWKWNDCFIVKRLDEWCFTFFQRMM